ncbi:MAG: TolC family protein [Verrucomicrobiota bacterium]
MKPLLSILIIFGYITFSLGQGEVQNHETPQSLTLKQACDFALSHHPEIESANLKANASEQKIRENRAAFFPQISANVNAVGPDDNSRITASGGLNNPSVFSRQSDGLSISQLITDFGRTANLTSGSRFQAYAEEQRSINVRARVLLRVQSAYFEVLGSQAILNVAQHAVTNNELLVNQVRAMVEGKLKSELDLGFAETNLGEARLVQLKAGNRLNEAFANLSEAMGMREKKEFQLIEENDPSLEGDENILIQKALEQRTDLIAAKAEKEALLKFANAEKAAQYPEIKALGEVGVTPIADKSIKETYAIAGLNLHLPIINGGKLSAKAEAARLQAEAAQKNISDLENKIYRDVRVAWGRFQSAFQEVEISRRLQDHASQTLELAQSRYKLGMSSIIELSSADLEKTKVDMNYASARHELQMKKAELDYQTGDLNIQ